MSNAEAAYSAGALATQPAMDLSDYVGHEAALETIVRQHRATHRGYKTAATVPFFCIKIPRTVLRDGGRIPTKIRQWTDGQGRSSTRSAGVSDGTGRRRRTP
jgi:hypothetical protein